MSTRELAKNLIDQVPESKLLYVIAYLQGATLPDDAEIPNAETQAAFAELDNGGGEHFSGTTEELFKKILSEPDEEEDA